MKLAIFTGIHEGKRFFDHYIDDDIEANAADYEGDDRHDFEFSDDDIEAKRIKMSADDRILDDCIKSLSKSDKLRFLRNAYRCNTERELICDEVDYNLMTMAIDDLVEDCLLEVERKYMGEK